MLMTEKAFQKAADSYKGFCVGVCKKITNQGNVEGDAVGYLCVKCKKPTVMGLDNALLEGMIDIK
jgi:hypothetical protein